MNYPALKSASDWCIKHSIQIPDDIVAGLYSFGIDVKTPGYYARVMWEAVRELYAGDIEAYDFEEVMLRLISEQLRKAWNEGMRTLELDPETDQTEEGEAALQEIMSSELDYVGQLAEDIIAAAEAGTSVKGGEGSGNFGHEGRPGEVGGSGPGWGAGEGSGDSAPSGTASGESQIQKTKEFLGKDISTPITVLGADEFDQKFVTAEDRLSGHIAGAIYTKEGEIFIRENFVDAIPHEMVHAAGAMPDTYINHFVNEGITQYAAEAIGRETGADVHVSYSDNTRYVRDNIIPYMGMDDREFISSYLSASDKPEFVASTIWGKYGDKFGDKSEWGNDPYRGFKESILNSYGQNIYIDYIKETEK